VNGKPVSRGLQHPCGCAHCQVLGGWSDVRAFYLNGDTPPLPPFRLQCIRQVDQAEQSLDPMQTVIVSSQDPQKEI
jgi:hypothetical protein